MMALTAKFLREHFRFAWKLIVVEIGVAWLLPYALVTFNRLTSGGDPGPIEAYESRNFLINSVSLSVLAYGSCGVIIVLQSAKARRILPVSNQQMTGSLLLATIINVAVMYAVTVIGYRLMFGIDWPVVSSTCWTCGWFALVAGCFFWLSDSRWFRFPIVAALIGLAGYWMFHRVDVTDGTWSSFHWSDIAFVIVTVILSYSMLLPTYVRFRHGDFVKGRVLKFLINAEGSTEAFFNRESHQRFSNGRQSMLWLESQRALLSKLVVTILISTALIGVLTMMIYSGEATSAIWLVIVQATFVSGAACGTMANDIVDPAKRTMKHHFSVVPMTTAELTRCFRKSILHNVVVGCVVAVASYAIGACLAAVIRGSWEPIVIDFADPLFCGLGVAGICGPIGLAFACSWIAGGLGATVPLLLNFSPGKSVLAFYLLLVGGVMAVATRPFPTLHQIAVGILILFFVMMAAYVGVELRKAYQRQHITARTAVTAAVCVVIFSMIVSVALPAPKPLRIIAGLTAVWAAIPYSCLPLTVQAFRHR